MGGGERRVAGEGSLFAMAHRLKSLPDNEWHRYSINLPDRGAAPFSYSSEQFASLLAAHDRARV